MKILFCQLRNHGDIIRTFPLIDAIKLVYPDWYIGFTCFNEMINTCKLESNIDVIIPQPRFLPVTDTQDGTRILDCNIFQECVKKAKNEHFDIYVDLHGVFQSAVFGAMCNINIRLGRSAETSKDGAFLFYTNICHIKSKEINRMERHFLIFNTLFPEIKPAQRTYYAKNKVVMFPGSSKKGFLKRWDISRYIQLATSIEKRSEVIFILGEEDADLKYTIEKNTKCTIKMCNQWEQIEREIEDAKIVIGNDAAYIHLAIWKNIPAIEICGPLSPIVNGVWKYGKGETIFVKKRCKCSNLWKGICEKSHECLEQITVEKVLTIVEKYL